MKDSSSRFDVLGQLVSLRRYARSLTREDGAAEDLVHEALVRAYERRGSFRRDGNLRAWLLSILHRAFIDGLRSRKAEAARLEQAALVAEHETSPPQEHSVRLAQVRAAFRRLPEDQRAALHLVAVEGLSYQEAADALQVPMGTLMSRIGRARATLREMEDNGGAKGPHLRIVGGQE